MKLKFADFMLVKFVAIVKLHRHLSYSGYARPVLYSAHKCKPQHTAGISNRAESHKGFIATTSLVSYAGHPKQVAKQLSQQHALLYFSHATQSISQQH